MTKNCPTCDKDLREHLANGFSLTPYEGNDKVGTLQFCSPSCRGTYKRHM